MRSSFRRRFVGVWGRDWGWDGGGEGEGGVGILVGLVVVVVIVDCCLALERRDMCDMTGRGWMDCGDAGRVAGRDVVVFFIGF